MRTNEQILKDVFYQKGHREEYLKMSQSTKFLIEYAMLECQEEMTKKYKEAIYDSIEILKEQENG